MSRGAGEGEHWWRGAVIYQVYVRSFADSDGDGQGDLRGLTARLDYIRDLGVDAIWLSPVHPSPDRDWGYDVADYDGVHHDYGTMQDFAALIEAAHARGMRVLLDEVLAHTSDAHAWFAASQKGGARADWYVWAEGRNGGPPNNWLSSFSGPAWTWSEARSAWFHHKFMPNQPKLNWRNAEARSAALAVLDGWLARGADGFRLDVANAFFHDPALADNPEGPDGQLHLNDANQTDNMEALDAIRRIVEARGGFVFGEFFEEAERAGAYAAPDEGLHSAYTFPLLLARDLTPDLIRDHYEGLAHHPRHWPSLAFSNHDVMRAPSRFGGGQGRAEQVLALLFSLKATVLLYQGEELGLPQATVPEALRRDPIRDVNGLPEGRDGSRTPMPWDESERMGFTTGDPWLPPAAEHRGMSVATQAADPASCLNFTRDLIALRKATPALVGGDVAFIDSAPGVLAFERRQADQRVLCEFALGGPLPAALQGRVLLERRGDYALRLTSL